jgi:hypothetical protein
MLIEDTKLLANIFNPIAKDNGSIIGAQVIVKGDVINHFHYSSLEANAIQNKIEDYKDKLKEPEKNNCHMVVLYWNQAKFGKARGNSDKAIIENICADPVKVIFDNNAIKNEMTTNNPNFKKDWQDLAYIVDVEVGTILGKPKTYKIVKYYPEDTFDPEIS